MSSTPSDLLKRRRDPRETRESSGAGAPRQAAAKKTTVRVGRTKPKGFLVIEFISLLERSEGCAVIDYALVDEFDFQGKSHGVWLADMENGETYFVLTDPQLGVYPEAEWSSSDQVFSYHIGHVLRQWDRRGWITEIQLELPPTPTEIIRAG